MLDHLGEPEAAAAILTAVEDVLAHGGDVMTPDMGGQATTAILGKAICEQLSANASAER
jgi:tartrate dehydrogenase/decarboxylase/D-malate dehydrogenase